MSEMQLSEEKIKSYIKIRIDKRIDEWQVNGFGVSSKSINLVTSSIMKQKPILNRQHVLSHPQVYLGSLQEVEEDTWVVQKNVMVRKRIKFFPAVLKLFDQILINAAEQRLQGQGTTFIHINVQEDGCFIIINDGNTFPPEPIGHNRYVLQAVFGDTQSEQAYKQLGYSTKIVNIFSKYCFVETGHPEQGVALKAQWHDNMSRTDPLEFIPYSGKSYTRIGFNLDLEKLGLNPQVLSAHMMALMERRAYDIAGLNRLRVTFNKRKIVLDHMIDYARLFVRDQGCLFYDKENTSPRWSIIIAKSNCGFQQMSFVNNCRWTRKGGSHVNSVIAQIASKALQTYGKRLKDSNQVRNKVQKYQPNCLLFISVYLQDPQWETPLRDKLKTPIQYFESIEALYCMSDPARQFLQQNKMGEIYKQIAHQRQKKKRSQKEKVNIVSKTNVFKLIDDIQGFNDAFKVSVSCRCVLLVALSQAHKNIFLNSLYPAKRQYFTGYVLKNSLKNARDYSISQCGSNEDFHNLQKIIGLNFGKAYNSTESLRYSKVLIVANQDKQGSAAKGLLLNYFDCFWPSLCHLKGFLSMLVLPRLRCTNQLGKVKYFISQESFNSWKKQHTEEVIIQMDNLPLLGSWDSQTMRAVLLTSRNWVYNVVYKTSVDNHCLKNFYLPTNADRRRNFLQQFRPLHTNIYCQRTHEVTVRDFMYKEVIAAYFHEHQERTPSCVDGLNAIQRKVLYTLFKMGSGKKVRVKELVAVTMSAGFCALPEEDIQKETIALGQQFVGSNNLPLITPVGHFGSRFSLGRDYAPVQYLWTELPELTKLLFPAQDLHVIQYINQDSEPRILLPILPLLLINGYRDQSTPWSSKVFNHKVEDVIQLIKARIGKVQKSIKPHWNGFKGRIDLEKKDIYFMKGAVQTIDTHTIRIRQIPIGQSTSQFKTFLEEHKSKGDYLIDTVQEKSQDDDNIEFLVRFQNGHMPSNMKILLKYLNLSEPLLSSNMTVLNAEGRFQKYPNINSILDQFYLVRLKGYEKRKEYLITKKIRQIQQATQRSKFIKQLLSGEFPFTDSKRIWNEKLAFKKFVQYQEFTKIRSTLIKEEQLKDFEYLNKLNLAMIDQDKLKQLKVHLEDLQQQLALLKKMNIKELWLSEINQFQQAYKEHIKTQEKSALVTKKRLDLMEKQLSELSIKRNPKPPEDSSVSDFQLSRTEQIMQEQKQCGRQHLRTLNQDQENVPIPVRNGIRYDQYDFNKKLANMEKKIAAQRQKAARQKQQQQQQKNAGKPQTKKQREIEQKKRLAEQLKKKEVVPVSAKMNGHQRRQGLARHAAQMFKKVQEDKRRQMQQRRSEKSDDRSEPRRKQPPAIIVPYTYTHFQINQVQRKRFSNKQYKYDPDQIRGIQENLDRKENKKNGPTPSQFIDIDD